MDPTPKKRGRPRLPTPERQQNRLASKAKWRRENREQVNKRKRLQYYRGQNTHGQRTSTHDSPETTPETATESTLADFLESPRIHYARVASRVS